jgi:hypothetical protein
VGSVNNGYDDKDDNDDNDDDEIDHDDDNYEGVGGEDRGGDDGHLQSSRQY